MKKFRDLVGGEGVYVFDGAVGTRLYDKGIYINRSYDELNLTQPDLVKEVHDERLTVEAELLCIAAHERWKGHLSRIQVENAEPLGSLLGWTPYRTVIQWAVEKA